MNVSLTALKRTADSFGAKGEKGVDRPVAMPPFPHPRVTKKAFGEGFEAELLSELRKEIAIGSEQADRGEFVDGAQTFAEIRRRSARRKRAKG